MCCLFTSCCANAKNVSVWSAVALMRNFFTLFSQPFKKRGNGAGAVSERGGDGGEHGAAVMDGKKGDRAPFGARHKSNVK